MNVKITEAIKQVQDVICRGVNTSGLYEVSVEDEGQAYTNLRLIRDAVDALEADLAATKKELELSKRYIMQGTRRTCREIHFQNCSVCEDVECGDNTSPGIKQLKTEIDTLREDPTRTGGEMTWE
jgi:hypothetical protein